MLNIILYIKVLYKPIILPMNQTLGFLHGKDVLIPLKPSKFISVG